MMFAFKKGSIYHILWDEDKYITLCNRYIGDTMEDHHVKCVPLGRKLCKQCKIISEKMMMEVRND